MCLPQVNSSDSPYLTYGFLADGEYDAAEIDREIISARLKQDVMEHSGKVHSFIADMVSHTHIALSIFNELNFSV